MTTAKISRPHRTTRRRNLHELALIMALIGLATVNSTVLAQGQTITRPIEKPPEAVLTFAKPASEFTDEDITIPRHYDPRGIGTCTGVNPEPATCPLRKYSLRIDVQPHDLSKPPPKGLENSWSVVTDIRLSEWISDYVNRIGRFNVISRTVDNPVRPDAVLRVSAWKSEKYVYKGVYGEATYGLQFSSALIDPDTGIMLASPRIPQIPVWSAPKKYHMVNGRVIVGPDFADESVVSEIFLNLFPLAFQGTVNALLNELPSTAQVVTIREHTVTLDRGTESGVLDKETMILYYTDKSVFIPIAVVEVTPGIGSSLGTIAHWKKNQTARQIRSRAKDQELAGTTLGLYAVSVGAPANYTF